MIYRKFILLANMPPDGYTTVTISDSLATKLTRIMTSLREQARHHREVILELITHSE